MKTDRHTSTAIALHWLVGIMILISFAVGFYMSRLKFSPGKLKLYNWHKWAGLTIFISDPALFLVVRSNVRDRQRAQRTAGNNTVTRLMVHTRNAIVCGCLMH